LYEAAVVDGANACAVLEHHSSFDNKFVILVSLISMIWTFADSRSFDMTRGDRRTILMCFDPKLYSAFQNLDIAKGIATALFIVPIAISAHVVHAAPYPNGKMMKL